MQTIPFPIVCFSKGFWFAYLERSQLGRIPGLVLGTRIFMTQLLAHSRDSMADPSQQKCKSTKASQFQTSSTLHGCWVVHVCFSWLLWMTNMSKIWFAPFIAL
ncbi:uncharacterized protein LOC133289147 [Gastrolobium bilobum]|uniref:uncharacterized protein LOC133289147 n=1 Tax=Gastrolobium bilobum TaxID=150636 RepID=UPI002AB219FD|nr:uncharacterized protein LOC133289147 [Gastrolobium bilobum]